MEKNSRQYLNGETDIIIGVLNEDGTITTAVQYKSFHEDGDAECSFNYGTHTKYEDTLFRQFNTEEKVRNLINNGGWYSFVTTTEKVQLHGEKLRKLAKCKEEYKSKSSEFKKKTTLTDFTKAISDLYTFVKAEHLYLFGSPTKFDRFPCTYTSLDEIREKNKESFIYIFNPAVKQKKWAVYNPPNYAEWLEKKAS